MSCGLPLCFLNPPMHCCPSCGSALLSQPAAHSLLLRVETELEEILQKEEDQRRRAEEEIIQREGGFPTLGAAAVGASSAVAAPQAYKVMSLTQKKVTVSRMTPKATPPSSSATSRAQTPDLEEGLPKRIPPPPDEVPIPHACADPQNDRPWRNLREDLSYVDPARL